jgi:hypothetical protein
MMISGGFGSLAYARAAAKGLATLPEGADSSYYPERAAASRKSDAGMIEMDENRPGLYSASNERGTQTCRTS